MSKATKNPETRPKPVAVLISDVHFNLQTLPLASAATQMAIDHANRLNVHLCVLGDLHDTKANLRGECVNELIRLFSQPMRKQPRILIGNHDLINEKSKEHSLGFLAPYARIIDEPWHDPETSAYFIPYRSDSSTILPPGHTGWRNTLLLCHQGLTGTIAGEYFNDKSAFKCEAVASFRVVSGHYHFRQDIRTADGTGAANNGSYSFLGNPYTLSFGEAGDPEKGYQILMDDGSLEFVPTNLRKHVIFETVASDLRSAVSAYRPEDLLWVKVTGTYEEVSMLTRAKVAEKLGLPLHGWKLDLIPTSTASIAEASTAMPSELLDKVIDDLQNVTDEQKLRLKTLWKGII